MSESKHEKFQRLSSSRLEKALDAIRVIGNLASPNYEWTQEEARGLVQELDTAIGGLREAFGLVEVEVSNETEAEKQGIHRYQIPSPTPRENDHLWRIAPQLNAAVEAIQDKQYGEARDIILGITTS